MENVWFLLLFVIYLADLLLYRLGTINSMYIYVNVCKYVEYVVVYALTRAV